MSGNLSLRSRWRQFGRHPNPWTGDETRALLGAASAQPFAEAAAGQRRAGQLRCAFGDGPDGRRHLLGLELGGRPVGDARIYFLERFWLDDPAAIDSGAARLDDRVPPPMLLAAVVGRPHPALLIVLLAALLAGAALAGRRLSERLR